jgi:hypothetical protein
MDVALDDGPVLRGRVSDPLQPAREGGCEGLLLEVSAAESPALARREGYTQDCWRRLLEAAGDASLAGLLLDMAEAASDLLDYRRALHRLAGPPSLPDSHYLPHPVRLDDGPPAIVFVAPAVGATGIPGVDSAKASFPGLGAHDLRGVFALPDGVYPPFDEALQTRYAGLCLLAGAHGIHVGDLLPAELEPTHPVAALLRRWREDPAELDAEREALRAGVPGLGNPGYERRFPASLDAALERSGLAPYF